MSCDPVHTINFTNKAPTDSKVKIILRPDTEVYEFRRLAKGDSIVFLLKPEVIESINFGVGTWSDEDIDHLAGAIKSLEIKGKGIRTIYETTESIEALLQENKKGRSGWETQILIEIE